MELLLLILFIAISVISICIIFPRLLGLFFSHFPLVANKGSLDSKPNIIEKTNEVVENDEDECASEENEHCEYYFTFFIVGTIALFGAVICLPFMDFLGPVCGLFVLLVVIASVCGVLFVLSLLKIAFWK